MKIGVSLPVREMGGDLAAIRDFAQSAEGLGLTHLRVPDQVLRPGSGPAHEPMTLLAYIAAVTDTIELVPSVIVLPSRQTVLFAKQAAELDVLSGGRLRLGIGVGGNESEYRSLGQEFHSRGARCDEQMTLLKELWTSKEVEFSGRWDQVSGAGLDPLPVQRPIPMWIGASAEPSRSVVRRIGRLSSGWFVLCTPEQFPSIRDAIVSAAASSGRPDALGMEAGVAVVGSRESEWRDRVVGWRRLGLSHLCLRTLGGGLTSKQHVEKLTEVVGEIPER